MKVFVLFATVICLFGPSCVLKSAAVSQGNRVMITVPKGSHLELVDPGEPPTLFQFLLESDYVVVAVTRKATAVGLRVKSPTLNMAEWMVGTVNEFQVEELLFAKEQFYSHQSLDTNTTRTFETFKKMGDWREIYNENTRYLLFLKEIPKTDEIFGMLELDKEKHYYRTYKGTKSILPDTPDPMHGTNNVGRIDLSAGRYSELVEALRQLCEALSPGDNNVRVSRLVELAKSDNKVLSLNAKYAIKHLSRNQFAETPSPRS